MWSFDPPSRRCFLAALPMLALVGACGFSPALGPGGSLAALRGRVRVADPNTRNDFALRDHLARGLGGASGPDLDLGYRLSTHERDAGITPDQVITRRQIDGQVTYVLTDQASGAVLAIGAVSGFTSYGTTGTTASTVFARDDALQRLMVILADQIITRLAAVQGLGG